MLGEIFDTFIFVLLAADLLIWLYIFVSWCFIDQALYLCCEYIGVLDISLLAACRSFHEIVHWVILINHDEFTFSSDHLSFMVSNSILPLRLFSIR